MLKVPFAEQLPLKLTKRADEIITYQFDLNEHLDPIEAITRVECKYFARSRRGKAIEVTLTDSTPSGMVSVVYYTTLGNKKSFSFSVKVIPV